MKVSIGFEGVLDRPDVQQYCKELISSGVNVFITTSQYNPMLSHLDREADTTLLWELVGELGIPCQNVIFTNMLPKSVFLSGSDCKFHLDHDQKVKFDIINCTRVPVVMTTDRHYISQCKKLMGNAHN